MFHSDQPMSPVSAEFLLQAPAPLPPQKNLSDVAPTKDRAQPREAQVDGNAVVSAKAIDYAVIKKLSEVEGRPMCAVLADCVSAYLLRQQR